MLKRPLAFRFFYTPAFYHVIFRLFFIINGDCFSMPKSGQGANQGYHQADYPP